MGIKILKNEKLWMEQDAIRQLERISKFEGVEDVVGLPDLHSGITPVGATIKTKGCIFPILIGNDLGCGISLFETSVKVKKMKIDKIVKSLENTKIYGECSIGGGNHFIEIQTIDKIYNKEESKILGLDKSKMFLMIHSGSRDLGDKIYREFTSKNCLIKGTDDFDDYLNLHHYAVAYAKDNRQKLAEHFMNLLGIKSENQCLIDCVHNYLEVTSGIYMHHKGSISTIENKYAIIAGSRGSYSYIVKCIPNEEFLNSISHGAGRKWERSLCKGRLESKYKKDELVKSKLGGVVVTNEKALLYEEAPEAYKDIEQVVQILVDNHCVEFVARMMPKVTYKC